MSKLNTQPDDNSTPHIQPDRPEPAQLVPSLVDLADLVTDPDDASTTSPLNFQPNEPVGGPQPGEHPAPKQVAVQEPESRERDGRPNLSDKALQGFAGGIVKKLLPETEAHAWALLVEFLVQFGNIIGRTAFYQIEGTKHHGNLFAVKVGVTSKGRKGTASGRINGIFKLVEPAWIERHFTGLSSGEGVIWNVRDDGNPDKRMFIRADEFASTLAVMKRDGNTLSPVIRIAWDGTTLQITAKNSPAKSTDHHISIVADITQAELESSMRQSDKINGFANRFLWGYVDRSKILPFGGKDLDFRREVERLKKAIDFARNQGRIYMDDNARKVWARAYAHLSEGQPGMLGAVTSRAEAQVIRLALLYALLDMSDKIRTKHLHAALALWQYCEDSARFIFDVPSLEQKRILEFLTPGTGRTRTCIYRDLFGGHRKAELVTQDLEGLKRMGLVKSKVLNGAEYWWLEE